ncbi:type III secretion protein [Agaricicola taiwanensis]|uniref:Type III secretion protein n=1 Tax=Agaricicola taiwanensis TaxID=591372 RepID=A0A8J2VLF2_9RHOB|nr:type III secretion protein [Agaricicola taiwanensis]GGE35998.1 type III secretion protein [Agaricicola taiwanensis]
MPAYKATFAVRGLLVASAFTLLAGGSAIAAEPKWSPEPYSFVVVDQNVRDTLLEFGRNNDIPVRLTDGVRGRIRGSISGLSPRDFLERVTKDHGLVWYFDGALLHISAASEVSTQVFAPVPPSPDRAMEKLQASNILDDKFSVRPAADGVSLAVTGPPAFRAAVIQATTTTINVVQKPLSVRVFRGGKANS